MPRRPSGGQRAIAVEPEWEQILIRRTGAPPLRFKGLVVDRHEGAHGGAITLWQKKRGGYAIAVSAGQMSDAGSGDTLSDIMDWLENKCRERHVFDPNMPLGTFLTETPAALSAIRDLRLLAGRAMDAWDRLLEQGAA